MEALTVPRHRTYEQIKSNVIAARKQNDTNDWNLGDLTVELLALGESIRQQITKDPSYKPSKDDEELSKDDRTLIERLADDAGMPKKALFIRYKISTRVPKTGPLSWIRHSTLTYATMRELYALESDDDLNKIAKKAVSQNMTVREVRQEMEGFRDKKGVESGIYICKTCDEPIKHIENLVAIAKSGQARATFCGWGCASAYVDKKMQEDGVILSRTLPTEEALPLEGVDLSFEGGVPFSEGMSLNPVEAF